VVDLDRCLDCLLWVIVCAAVCRSRFQAIVQSFLGFGLQGLKPRLGGYDWSELQELNAAIHWQVGEWCAGIETAGVKKLEGKKGF
jgi:hypothetical protein